MHLLCDWGCPDVVTEVYDALLLRLKRWRESLFSISHVILCRLLIETFRPLLKVDIDSTHKRGPCCLYCTTPSAPPRSTTPKRIQRRITCLIPDFFFLSGNTQFLLFRTTFDLYAVGLWIVYYLDGQFRCEMKGENLTASCLGDVGSIHSFLILH